MTASMTIFPYEPFELDSGITLLDFQNKVEFSQLIFRINKLKKHDTLIDDTDRIVHFYTDEKNPLDEKLKDIAFIGDLTQYEINSTANLKYVFQKAVQDSALFKDKLESINSQINDIVFDSVTNYTASLTFDPYSDFEKLLKVKDVRLDSSKWENYCDKIISIVSFYVEFTSKKLLLFHNLEKLLSFDQLNELNDYLKSVDLKLVSLESYPMIFKEEKLNAKVYSIDNDHVRFDY